MLETVSFQEEKFSQSSVEEVRRVDTKSSTATSKTEARRKTFACYRCGAPDHNASNSSCPARKATCTGCQSVGHFAKQCRSKGKSGGPSVEERKGNSAASPAEDKRKRTIRRVVEDESSDEEYAFQVTDGQSSDNHVFIIVGGVEIRILVDSGATCNLITQPIWEEMKRNHVKCKCEPSNNRIFNYGRRVQLPVMGSFTAEARNGEKRTIAKFYVLKDDPEQKFEPLLSSKTSKLLGVLQLLVMKSEALPRVDQVIKLGN